MTDVGDGRNDHERRRPRANAVKTAWQRTLADMDALVADHERAGRDVIEIVAGNTGPTGPADRDDDRFGLVFVVPDNQAEPFQAAVEQGAFPRYEVYRETVDDHVFLVVEFRDPNRETVILIAGQYALRNAPGMASAAMAADTIYTRVQTLDGTVLGSFRHGEYEKFIPNVERVAGWYERNS